LFAIFGAVAVSLAALYYDYFNITDYTAPFFDALFNTYWAAAVPVLALIVYYLTFQFFKRTCISMQDFLKKHDVAKTEDLVVKSIWNY
jgi:hypothetical protein